MNRNPKTAFICEDCKRCDREKATHPGMRHKPGICGCSCQDVGNPTHAARRPLG